MKVRCQILIFSNGTDAQAGRVKMRCVVQSSRTYRFFSFHKSEHRKELIRFEEFKCFVVVPLNCFSGNVQISVTSLRRTLQIKEERFINFLFYSHLRLIEYSSSLHRRYQPRPLDLASETEKTSWNLEDEKMLLYDLDWDKAAGFIRGKTAAQAEVHFKSTYPVTTTHRAVTHFDHIIWICLTPIRSSG